MRLMTAASFMASEDRKPNAFFFRIFSFCFAIERFNLNQKIKVFFVIQFYCTHYILSNALYVKIPYVNICLWSMILYIHSKHLSLENIPLQTNNVWLLNE